MNCDFCWRHCDIPDGKNGFCQVRRNEGGTIRSLHYGQLVSLALDPIEKKPLYHFLPGTLSLSVAEAGCNYRCQFCQNYTISQPGREVPSRYCPPDEVVALARKYQVRSISYTYSEPSVWQDYMVDVATLAQADGMRNVMVTNGSFSREAWGRVFPVIDALNIDVKGDDSFYASVCQGRLGPVLDSVGEAVRRKKHLEVTTLLIEGIHTWRMVEDLGKRLSDRGVQVWHLSRFFPQYQMVGRKETSESFLEEMLEAAGTSGIPYIYGGNSRHIDATRCPSCHAILIHDHRYGGTQRQEASRTIVDGRCAVCGCPVYGVFA
ncbi:MAG: AmmeMemoRadiSam system radical SAM enzyme [Sphaerochaetaceae bacterium]|nr:AmmeMemoRadiSam system radical SAM enzyme [Spirochaetales bacterium]MDY5498980.1 AmmeMemoRadiSam system radical SAM enzyme [Sphaerochaetaceae bacterium]